MISCETKTNEPQKETQQLQKEVDSLKNELYKCNMLLEAYEGMPLTI